MSEKNATTGNDSYISTNSK